MSYRHNFVDFFHMSYSAGQDRLIEVYMYDCISMFFCRVFNFNAFRDFPFASWMTDHTSEVGTTFIGHACNMLHFLSFLGGCRYANGKPVSSPVEIYTIYSNVAPFSNTTNLYSSYLVPSLQENYLFSIESKSNMSSMQKSVLTKKKLPGGHMT